MKKNVFISLFGLGLLFTTCICDNLLPNSNDTSRQNISRPETILLQDLMKKQNGSFERFQSALMGKIPLYEFVKISFSQDYGLYFWIPVKNKKGIVEGSLIFPLDEEKNDEKKCIFGYLGTPIFLNKSILNHIIPKNRRYLYSWMFRELNDNGIIVESDLIKEAIQMENNNANKIQTRSSGIKVIGGVVFLNYQLSSTGFVDPYGRPIITTLSKQTLQEIIKSEYRGHSYYGVNVYLEKISQSFMHSMDLYLDFGKQSMYLESAIEDLEHQLYKISNKIKQYYSIDIMFQYNYRFYEDFQHINSSGGCGATGTKDPNKGIDTGGYNPTTMYKLPCYNVTTEKSNPLVQMITMPPNHSNLKGARFGKTRKNRNGDTIVHQGIDLAAPPGTPIHSMYDGIIVGPYITSQPNRINKKYPKGYSGDRNDAGNRFGVLSYVKGQYITVYYWHLNANNPVATRMGKNLQVGDSVFIGEIIGFTGITGNASADKPHLHLGIKNSNKKWIDPEKYFNATINKDGYHFDTPCK